MTLQDVINQIERRRIDLLQKKQQAMQAISTINTDDARLKLDLINAVHELYEPSFKQCQIEIDILTKAQQMMES